MLDERGEAGGIPECSRCGAEIPWKPVEREGKLYCCEVCAQGSPCLLSHRIGGLPVLKGEELVGIITETDLLEAFVEMLGIWSTGSRVELVVEERPGAFTKVSQIVQERGGEVLGAVAARMLDQGKWVLLVRVRTPALDELLEALKGAGHPALSSA